MFTVASKKSITLLLVTEKEVMRADCKPGARATIKSFQRAARPARTPVQAAAELAVSLSDEKPSQRTILLAEDVWTGVIDLDERSIYGLEGDELVQMLRFETESLSGLDPMTSQLGIVELSPVPPDTRRFWGVGVAGEVLSSIATTIALRGGKLVRLAHPVGVCSPVAEGEPWVEFHETLAGAFAAVSQGVPRASIAPRSRNSDRWYKSLESSFDGALPEQGWIWAGAEAPAGYSGSLRLLDDDESVERWICGAMDRLVQRVAVPVVAPPVPPTSTRRLAQVSTAAAVAMAVCCGLHFANVSWTKASLQKQIQALQQPAAEKKKLEDALKPLSKQLTEMETELQTLDGQRSDLAAVTGRADRFSELLRLIASEWSEDMVIDRIKPNSNGLQLVGRTITSNSASLLAQRLSPHAQPLGWQVEAPELEGENKMVNGGPWKFHIDLVDISFPVEDGLREGAEELATIDKRRQRAQEARHEIERR